MRHEELPTNQPKGLPLKCRPLAHALPQRELRGERIINNFGSCVEVHRRPAGEIVLGPAAFSCGGKGNPGTMDRCRERLWRIWTKDRLSSKPERIKHERYLQRMRGTQASAELRRAPGEFVHKRRCMGRGNRSAWAQMRRNTGANRFRIGKLSSIKAMSLQQPPFCP